LRHAGRVGIACAPGLKSSSIRGALVAGLPSLAWERIQPAGASPQASRHGLDRVRRAEARLRARTAG